MTLPVAISERYDELKQRHHLVQFWVLVSFLVTFGLVRTVTHLQKAGVLPNQNGGGVHIHHMVPGIILVLVSGYVGLSAWSHPRIRLATAVAFGIGSALTIDEFALWLFLDDVYWAKEGRDSVDAVIITVVLLIMGTLVGGVWPFGRQTQRSDAEPGSGERLPS